MSAELTTIAADDQTRVLRSPIGHDFCSNDYFSLSRHETIIAAAQNSLAIDGYGSSSSRYIRGERDHYEVLQTKLAHFKQSESALLFSSGYAANLGVLSSLIKKDDVVFSDQLNHASIIDGVRLSGATIKVFPHNNVDSLRTMIAETKVQGQKFLVTESLFSMDGDAAPLDLYAEIAQQFNVALIVDEAHAVGLYGKNGAGLINHFGVENAVLVSTNGLGKAFGCYGAFVAGNRLVIDYLVQRARTLMFSTALPPLCISAIDAALSLIIEGNHLRTRLFQNVALLNYLLSRAGITNAPSFMSPIAPIILGSNQYAQAISDQLCQAGFDVRAIRPPTVATNSSRLRITTNVSQSTEMINSLVEHLSSFL